MWFGLSIVNEKLCVPYYSSARIVLDTYNGYINTSRRVSHPFFDPISNQIDSRQYTVLQNISY